LVRERSALATIIVSRRDVILSVRSFYKMHFLREFLSELEEILTRCFSARCVYLCTVRIVDTVFMTSFQRANLIAYRLVIIIINAMISAAKHVNVQRCIYGILNNKVKLKN